MSHQQADLASALKKPGLSPRELGALGEEYVALKLSEKGCTILARNYHTRYGEIDVIASDPREHTTIIAEVKTRRTKRFGPPEEAVTPAKVQRILKAAFEWVGTSPGPRYPFSLVVFSVFVTPECVAMYSVPVVL